MEEGQQLWQELCSWLSWALSLASSSCPALHLCIPSRENTWEKVLKKAPGFADEPRAVLHCMRKSLCVCCCISTDYLQLSVDFTGGSKG